MENKKKKIAAITAVLHYLQTEEEGSPELQQSTYGPESQDNFWTFSGRQTQMQLRYMSQMRLFPGWKG